MLKYMHRVCIPHTRNTKPQVRGAELNRGCVCVGDGDTRIYNYIYHRAYDLRYKYFGDRIRMRIVGLPAPYRYTQPIQTKTQACSFNKINEHPKGRRGISSLAERDHGLLEVRKLVRSLGAFVSSVYRTVGFSGPHLNEQLRSPSLP